MYVYSLISLSSSADFTIYTPGTETLSYTVSSSEFQGEITEVLLMGAGTRIPEIQERIMKASGKSELGKSVNTDEAAAIGAVYQAAAASKGFKVKKFAVRDATVFPIQVSNEYRPYLFVIIIISTIMYCVSRYVFVLVFGNFQRLLIIE